MPLDFVHHAQDFADFSLKRAGLAVENVAVGVSAGVAVIHELGVTANHAVVALDKLEQPQDAALVHDAEDKGRTRFKEILLDVFAETDEPFPEVIRLVLLDLPDVEIDEAHREHVVGEKGELVFLVLVVRCVGTHRNATYSCSFGVLNESCR